LLLAVVAGTGLAQQSAGLRDRGLLHEFGHDRVDHGVDRGSVSALSESISKSACAFPMISRAAFVLASSRSARSARAFNFPFSLCCAEVVADRAAGG